MKTETMQIKNEASDCGYSVINVSDFDEEQHEIFDPEAFAEYQARNAQIEAEIREAKDAAAQRVLDEKAKPPAPVKGAKK